MHTPPDPAAPRAGGPGRRRNRATLCRILQQRHRARPELRLRSARAAGGRPRPHAVTFSLN